MAAAREHNGVCDPAPRWHFTQPVIFSTGPGMTRTKKAALTG